MANVTPVSPDQIAQMAREENVPLPLAMAIYAVESSMGNDPTAYLDPRARAGKNGMSSKPDKIGWGSMQVTRKTFQEMMPDVDYYSANDEQLARAGMKYLAKAVKPDGSYDLDNVKRWYFGAGTDESFGTKPSTNSKIDTKMRQVLYNIQNNYKPGDDFRAVAQKELPAGVSPSASIAIPQPNQLQYIPIEPVEFNAEEFRNKREAAKTAAVESLTQTQQQQNAAMAQVLDAFGANPYGVFSETRAAIENVQEARRALRQNRSDFLFETPPQNDGLLGLLEIFGRRVAARETYAMRKDALTTAQQSMNDYQAVISAMMQNASAVVPTVQDQLAITNAGIKAADEAVLPELKQLEIAYKNSQIENRNLSNLRMYEAQNAKQEAKATQLALQQAGCCPAISGTNQAYTEVWHGQCWNTF